MVYIYIRWEVSNCTATVLWGVASMVCSEQHIVFLCSSHLPFSWCFVSIHEVHSYSSIDTATTWKKSCFILSDRSDFYIINNLLIAAHAFARSMLASLSADEILLSRYVNSSTDFSDLLLIIEMVSCLKHMNSVLFAFTWKPTPSAGYSRLCSRDLALAGVFARSARSSV